MTTPDYHRGFRDGVRFMILNLKEAAQRVEKSQWSEVENSKGHKMNVITRSGQPIFAARLRELALELEMQMEGDINAQPK